MGAPLGHAVNAHQRLPGEEKDYVQRAAQAGGGGRRELEGGGSGWMRMSERVGWSVWLRKQGSAYVCVFVCAHACMWFLWTLLL